METIKNYLDNMFANLPKTNQMLKLKNDLLSNMEEKYNELKNSGKSENEAIGIVISEFGNIDELISELGIEPGNEESRLTVVTEEDAKEFLSEKKLSGKLIGIGVFLCIMAPAMLILITQLIADGIIGEGFSENARDMLGVIALFLLVVPAVGIFIYSGMRMERYKYLKEDFELPSNAKAYIQYKNNSFSPTYTASLIIGVCLCILSPVALFVTSIFGDNESAYGVVILLAIIAIAVFIFIYFGEIRESFSTLLKIGDFSVEKKKNNKVTGAVASIVWPLATCIFLISGLLYGKWDTAWIVFPITGILFGMFSAVYNIIKGNENQ